MLNVTSFWSDKVYISVLDKVLSKEQKFKHTLQSRKKSGQTFEFVPLISKAKEGMCEVKTV